MYDTVGLEANITLNMTWISSDSLVTFRSLSFYQSQLSLGLNAFLLSAPVGTLSGHPKCPQLSSLKHKNSTVRAIFWHSNWWDQSGKRPH